MNPTNSAIHKLYQMSTSCISGIQQFWNATVIILACMIDDSMIRWYEMISDMTTAWLIDWLIICLIDRLWHLLLDHEDVDWPIGWLIDCNWSLIIQTKFDLTLERFCDRVWDDTTRTQNWSMSILYLMTGQHVDKLQWNLILDWWIDLRCMIDWLLIDWLIIQPTRFSLRSTVLHWLMDGWMHWLMAWLMDWLIDWLHMTSGSDNVTSHKLLRYAGSTSAIVEAAT